MHFVKKINYIDGYKISITFDDKMTKVVDLEPYLDKGVFLPLKEPEYFRLVKVRYDTLVWPNKADFCPDVLYEIGVDDHQEEIQVKPLLKPSRIKTSAIKYTAVHALKKKRPKKGSSHK